MKSVIFGIVLAAGLGRRMGMPKALVRLGDRTFHERAVRAFLDARFQVVVVVNPVVKDALPAEVAGERRVLNPDPDQAGGMMGSVRIGVALATALGASGVVILPVDYPLVTSDDVRAVAEALSMHAPIAVAGHGDRRGHPIGINHEIMEDVLNDPSLTTLRDVVRRDPGRVVAVEASPGVVLGVNTRDDLDRVAKRPFR